MTAAEGGISADASAEDENDGEGVSRRLSCMLCTLYSVRTYNCTLHIRVHSVRVVPLAGSYCHVSLRIIPARDYICVAVSVPTREA